MKKILTVSLFAIMAVGTAHADIASTTYVNSKVQIASSAAANAQAAAEAAQGTADLNEEVMSALFNGYEELNGRYFLADLDTTADTVVPAINEVKGLADAAQAKANANAEAIGTKDAQGNYTSGLGSRVESLEDEITTLSGGVGSVGTQIDNKINTLDVTEITESGKAIIAVSETDGKISATTGQIGESGLSFDVATQAELDAVSSVADANAKNIGDMSNFIENYGDDVTLADRLWRMSGDLMGVEADAIDALEKSNQSIKDTGAEYDDNNMGEMTITNLETTANTLVPAINEVKGLADAAQSAADAAQSVANTAKTTADLNEDIIGAEYEYEEMGGYFVTNLNVPAANTLVGAVNNAYSKAESAYTLAQDAVSYAEDAQATADAKVNKTQLGIANNNGNPFAVPDMCKAAGVVCAFVVENGVGGWQKVIDSDAEATTPGTGNVSADGTISGYVVQ